MKKILTLACICFLISKNEPIFAQKQTAITITLTKEAVKIINPSKRAVYLTKTFFTPAISKALLKQVTPKQLDLIKLNSGEETYPDCIKNGLAYNPAKTDEDASEVLFKTLKLYRIAKFDNIQNGQNFGEQSILVAPAKENKNIGGDCSYEKDFYIIIPTSAIEISK
jgi:hypothetical protein